MPRISSAHYCFLQMALDRESVVKATPFYKAVTRQDTGQDRATAAVVGGGGGGGRRSSKAKSRMDDARSVMSAGSRAVGAAKRAAATDNGPKAMLAKASLTSVLFELVRSDPWETVMRAGVSGLNARFSSNEGGEGGMDAVVTLADILLTDVRPEAKGNAYTMILAPLRPSVPAEAAGISSQGEKEGGSRGSGTVEREHGGAGPGLMTADVGEEGEGEVDRGPLIAVTAKMDGEGGDLDATVNLASFACNLMVEPIKVREFCKFLGDGRDSLLPPCCCPHRCARFSFLRTTAAPQKTPGRLLKKLWRSRLHTASRPPCIPLSTSITRILFWKRLFPRLKQFFPVNATCRIRLQSFACLTPYLFALRSPSWL